MTTAPAGARLGRGLRLALLGAAAFLALAPRAAGAHATILSSSPQPGERLQTAPGVVVLTFSQPLNIRLSRAEVDAPGGARFGQSSVSESEIRVRLTENTPGVYVVRWTSVSAGDGHVLSGSLRFGVGVRPGAAGSEEPVPAGDDLALAALRGVEYGSLLLAAGLLLLLQLAGRPPPLRWVRRPAWLLAPLAAAAAAGVGVVLAEAAAAAGGLSPDALAAYLGAGPSGWPRVARVALELAALLVAVRWPRAAAVPLGGALVALAAAGHAAAVRPEALGVAATSLHLAAAGLWAGGIAGLALQRPAGGWAGREGRALLGRFTPVALAAFAVTAATGVIEATGELAGAGDLVATAYGQVLGLKALAVLLMLPLSVLAWRRLLPAPRVEALLALVAVCASALLASFPLPPARLHEAEAARAGPAANLALPSEGDLTLASSAGETLVGLTLRPGRPGRNTAWLYVLPLRGEQEASGLGVRVSGGHAGAVRRCGPACRSADVDLAGGETIDVGVDGPGGGTAAFAIPALPAPDVRAAVDAVQREMHGLTTYRVAETVRPAREPVQVSYEYQAPDRLRFQVGQDAETVIAGTSRWSRDGPGAAWKLDAVPPLPVPTFSWDGSRIVSPRGLGHVVEEGRPLQGLAFFETDGEVPIWFELWVDSRGLVRRAEMRAQGHFMEHRYSDFDAPFSVQPPE